MALRGSYDIALTRRSGESFAYMADWDLKEPIVVRSQPPELSVGTSAGITEAGGEFSARDASPPYPVTISNWQDGAGQDSYDRKASSPNAFKSSYWMDVSDDGHFELGPMALLFADTTVENIVGIGNGAAYASFHPAAADPRKQLRALGRYTCVSGAAAGDFLSDTADTTLVVVAATGLNAITKGQAAQLDQTHDIAVGDFLFCPVHRELVKVTNVNVLTITVSRGQGGTSASAHTASETWYGFKWYPVLFAGVDPTEHVSALTSMGGYTYTAFHDRGTDGGSVWKGAGVSTADSWVSYASTPNVVALTSCAGYVCGVQEGYGATKLTTAGYWNTAGTWVAASVAAATSANPVATASNGLLGYTSTAHATAGLCAINNFVYWVTTDGASRSHIYRYQPAIAASFALVASLPPGFVATGAVTEFGNLYICGYTDTQNTDPDNATQGRYKGSLYILAGDSELSHLVSWGDSTHDYRAKGITALGPYLHILTNEDVRVWSIEHAGWWHYADIQMGSTYGSSGAINWDANGFTYNPATNGDKIPSTAGSCTGAYTVMATDTSASGTFTQTVDTSGGGVKYLRLTASANAWRRYTVAGIPAADKGTLEFQLKSGANMHIRRTSEIILAGSSKEVRLRITASATDGTTWDTVKFSLGTYDGANYTDVSTGWMSTINTAHVCRLTLDGGGANLYINRAAALSVPWANLKTVAAPNTSKVSFSVGWPTETVALDGALLSTWMLFRFTPDGSYPPSYVSTPTTTDMRRISCYEGQTIVPAPGVGINYIDPRFQNSTGWLETSDSAFHMGSVNKQFSSIDVTHSAIIDSSQTVTVYAYIDGVLAGAADNSTRGDTTTTLTLGAMGKRINVRVALTDSRNSTGNRAWAYRLRVYDITARFFPHNAKKIYTITVNCRTGVVMRNSHLWGQDPDAAIRHIFAIADNGEICGVSMLWGDFEARLADVEFVQGKSESDRYNKLVGDVTFRMREV